MKSPAFSDIAPYYDTLMADVDYEGWVEYIAKLYPDYGRRRLRILDMACGTGVCSVLYSKAGHDVIALDSSSQMLDVARNRFVDEAIHTQVVQSDMCSFELEQKVDMVTCLFDSINNLTSENELASCFACVFESLLDSGIFIFDMNTEYGLSTFWGDKTVVREDEHVFSIWRNRWDPRKKLAVLNLTLFVREQDVYRRIDEVHREKGYTAKEVSSVLRKVGFGEVSMFRHLTTERPSSVTGRIMFKARK
jgi:SAM-dependent methyltransferase